MTSIRGQISDSVFEKLEQESNKEVALAMQFQIIDQYKQERYYRRRNLLTTLITEFEIFQDKGLLFTPIDIVNIMFKAKLLFAVKTEHEYDQRCGSSRFMTEAPFLFLWEERNQKIDIIIEKHLGEISNSIRERTLISKITDFNGVEHEKDSNVISFFVELFLKLDLPFQPFFNGPELTVKKRDEVIFDRPSLGYTAMGTENYAYHLAVAQLRTFFNLLRVAGFLNRGQMDFGMSDIKLMAPTSPVFLGTNSFGCFAWEEDERKPWEKIPDGCLFRSFGYRGVANMYLDSRTFGGIEGFFIKNKIIFEILDNPWTKTSIYDIAPSLDILSSATQIPDLGAKILQIYCCLEHLFVPKTVQKDNVKYIVGAINALRPNLIHWFEKLYKLRCDYAHKGFVQRTENTLNLVFESIENTMALLAAKLNNNI